MIRDYGVILIFPVFIARRKAAEATMKRINVAYDLLRKELAAK